MRFLKESSSRRTCPALQMPDFIIAWTWPGHFRRNADSGGSSETTEVKIA
jgi:hypothetical protein